jgi:hypothetical protein
MLPPVEADEALVAQGRYQQIRQGRPTRMQEVWTAHGLPDGALIWRSHLLVDGVAPISACYLLRDPQWHPVQLVFYWRWQDGREDMIEYRFMPDHAIIVYRDRMQDMILPVGYEVYGWHTVTENFLWAGYDRLVRGTQSFSLVAPGIQHDTLWPSVVSLEAALEQSEILPGPGGPHGGFAFSIQMAEMGPQRLHFDEHGVPVRWALPEEELTVELVEYTRMG